MSDMAERSNANFVLWNFNSHCLIKLNVSRENNELASSVFKISTFQQKKNKKHLNVLGSKFDHLFPRPKKFEL